MPDREKVIKGIQECDLNGGLIGNCPYKGILAMLEEQEQMYYTLEHDWRMCRELLKEQEAVKPKCKERMGGFVAGLCPTCGTALNNVLNVKACGKCGQAVKWE